MTKFSFAFVTTDNELSGQTALPETRLQDAIERVRRFAEGSSSVAHKAFAVLGSRGELLASFPINDITPAGDSVPRSPEASSLGLDLSVIVNDPDAETTTVTEAAEAHLRDNGFLWDVAGGGDDHVGYFVTEAGAQSLITYLRGKFGPTSVESLQA